MKCENISSKDFKELIKKYQKIIGEQNEIINQNSDTIKELKKELGEYERKHQRRQRIKNWFFIKKAGK